MLEELTRWAKRLGFASAEAARSALANRMLAIREEQASSERKAAGRAAMPPEVAHGSRRARSRNQAKAVAGQAQAREDLKRAEAEGDVAAILAARERAARVDAEVVAAAVSVRAAAGRVREAEAQGFLRIAREEEERFAVLIPRLEAKATELLDLLEEVGSGTMRLARMLPHDGSRVGEIRVPVFRPGFLSRAGIEHWQAGLRSVLGEFRAAIVRASTPEANAAPAPHLVRFMRGSAPYRRGDLAGFPPDDAARYVEAGVAVYAVPDLDEEDEEAPSAPAPETKRRRS